jgi:hypothetical protein
MSVNITLYNEAFNKLLNKSGCYISINNCCSPFNGDCSFFDKDDGERYGFYLIDSSDYDYIAGFVMCQLPGCCGICLSTKAYVSYSLQGRGLGLILAKLRIAIAKEAGYTVLMCTDVDTNVPQRKIMSRLGWKDIYQFNNLRTGNDVNISVLDLTKVSSKDLDPYYIGKETEEQLIAKYS